MSKTELTRKIEKALFAWYPKQFAGCQVDTFRPGFSATEVPVENGTTTGGLIDYVRVQECYLNEQKAVNDIAKKRRQIEVLIICIEIKVSLSDFFSRHGHNFVGNANYYAVPAELYPQIRSRVPPGIGVLVYYSGPDFFGIRKKIEAEYRELSDEKQKWLILSIAKRHNKYLKQRLKEAQERIRRDEIF